MSLYRVVTKRRKCCNGVNIEAGMEAQFVTPVNMTVQVNNWQYVEDAFMRMRGQNDLPLLFRGTAICFLSASSRGASAR